MDGAIRTLELVHYDDDEVEELPPPDEWKAPSMVDYSDLGSAEEEF